MSRLTLIDDVPALPPRATASHKGDYGRVAILAGSRGMSGAATLAGLGALRGGAGLVRVLTAAGVQAIVAQSEPSLMTATLREDDGGRVDERDPGRLGLDWATVLAIGPGLGRSEALAELISGALREFPGPVVLDADGLNNIASGIRPACAARQGRPTVLTPHPGEFRRLCDGAGLDASSLSPDDEPRIALAAELARALRVVVVLKGARTVVTDGERGWLNTSGNPGMATGGMGDVLTGLIAALAGQGLPAFDAARLGVHAHGLAADKIAREFAPFGYLAREVANGIPATLGRLCTPPIGFR